MINHFRKVANDELLMANWTGETRRSRIITLILCLLMLLFSVAVVVLCIPDETSWGNLVFTTMLVGYITGYMFANVGVRLYAIITNLKEFTKHDE